MSDTSTTTLSASPTLVGLGKIDPNPYQPRQSEDKDAVEKIAESIRSMGLLQIPSARQAEGGRYQLAFGHTRLAAYRLLASQDERYGQMPLYIHNLDDLQMFEAGVAENIQRRDLNPIETALAMQRYMTGFGKTSEECGSFFGMSGATVRGKVRLLDLPDAAQSKLAEGVISEGTARALLSMAKVASEKEIQETLKDIEKNKDEQPPEAVVSDAIEQNDNVVTMFNSWHQGKPRAGDGLWLLDMKNFPNKMLPALTTVDAAISIGAQDDQKALALLGGINFFYPDDVLTDPNFETLKKINPEYGTRIEHLIKPPACNACPFYMVMGGTHFCGMKVCHERKKIAFMEQKMQDLSRTLKIGLYTEADGAYLMLDEVHSSHRKAFTDRNADLRLLPKQLFKGYAWQRFEGLDTDIAKLVAVGGALEKLAVKGSKSVGKKSEKEKGEMRAMRQYRMRRKELLWEYTAEAQSLFEGVPMETLQVINRWKFIGIDDRVPDEHEPKDNAPAGEKLEYERRELVWRLVVEETSHYRRDDLVKLLDEFHAITKVRAPKLLVKLAKEWDAEIHELASVAAETGKGKKK